ncbi:UNVERIFIED_CONTAM: hypothetical protein K2H54_018435 [Gekko kuhli]
MRCSSDERARGGGGNGSERAYLDFVTMAGPVSTFLLADDLRSNPHLKALYLWGKKLCQNPSISALQEEISADREQPQRGMGKPHVAGKEKVPLRLGFRVQDSLMR